MFYQNVLDRMTKRSKEIFGGNLTGVYLHGSMAMGCFNPEKSDIHLLNVVEDDITDEQKLEFMKEVVALNAMVSKKGIELSVVKKKYCKEFCYPTPFELHFSQIHLQWFLEKPMDYVSKMKGTDKDLAAHFTITNHCGIVLDGEPVSAVFSAVPKKDYLDSIWCDIEGAKEDVLEDPMYIILNLCRVAAYLKDNLVTSKKQGGEWGLKNLESQYHPILTEAIRCYESDTDMEVDAKEAQKFAEYMLELIRAERLNVSDI